MTGPYVARSRMVAARELAGEMVIMAAPDSRLFNLNEVGTTIWKAADGVTPFAKLVDLVAATYEIEADEARADVEAFVQDLAGHGVLIVSDEPIADVPGHVRSQS